MEVHSNGTRITLGNIRASVYVYIQKGKVNDPNFVSDIGISSEVPFQAEAFEVFLIINVHEVFIYFYVNNKVIYVVLKRFSIEVPNNSSKVVNVLHIVNKVDIEVS